MLEQIDTYFNAERTESYVFIGFGLLALAFATYTLWRFNDAIFKGMAIPLILIGLVQLSVGATISLRTPSQVGELKTLYQQDYIAFKTKEIPRMQAVLKSFKLYKTIEIIFIVVSLLLIIGLSHGFWLGIGLGMLVQGALMLPADIFAQARGQIYMQQVGQVQ
jgi:sulfite exporter TauE/SafE